MFDPIADPDPLCDLAVQHGLEPPITLTGNSELGLDFRVTFARDTHGQSWVLRQPRHENMSEQIQAEARILSFLKPHLPFAIPDWQKSSPALVVYPLLPNVPAYTFDLENVAVKWAIDPGSPAFTHNLGQALAALHAIPTAAAQAAGLKVYSPAESRQKALDDFERVEQELGMHPERSQVLQQWLHNDACWPDFCVVVHGDLHPGHILVNPQAEITGMIDWSETRVDDPALDMISHLMLFRPEGLQQLVQAYEAAGGRTWPGLLEHTTGRQAAIPLVYAMYALKTQHPEQLAEAKAQLELPVYP
jgi:macrolide phosphotransferase